MGVAQFDRQDVLGVLKRLLGPGPLNHVPKRRTDLEALLALAGALFEVGRAYREHDVNERLQRWLDNFVAPDSVDHVSIRRLLVDEQFLLRDAAGAAYRPNSAKIDSLIDAAAKSIDPGDVMESIRREREVRKRARVTD